MSLKEQFRPLLDKYPPDYKLIKSQLIDDFAKPHEGVWNSLHFELLALEYLAIVGHSSAKPKVVAQSLTDALQDAQDGWSHVFQQLRNATDDLSAEELKSACQSGGVYQPIRLEPSRVAVERLGNALLERIGRMGLELNDSSPEQVAARAIRRALKGLEEKHLTLATTGAGFVDLRDRLCPKLVPLEQNTQTSEAGTRKMVLLAAVAVILVGVSGWFLTRDTRTAEVALAEAKANYQAGEFGSAVSDGEAAIDKLKAEGASAQQIHQARKFLSSAYYKVNDLSAAIQQMEILVKAYPDNTEYRKTLAQLKSEL